MIKKISSYFRARNMGLTVVVALLYYILTQLSVLIISQNTGLTPVWPMTGIAFAALLLVGLRILPGIILGSAATNIILLVSNADCDIYTAVVVSILISAGLCLELIAGFSLLNKSKEQSTNFGKVKSVFEFVLVTVFVLIIGASIGAGAMCLGGMLHWNNYSGIWFTWWLSSIAGVLTITPLVLTIAEYIKRRKWYSDKKVETLIIYVLIILIGESIFGNWIAADPTFIKPYLILLPLLWAAFRLGQLETIMGITLMALITFAETMKGHGPFAGPVQNASLLSSQLYVSIISITILIMRSAINEQQASEASLQLAHTELAGIVNKRTEELEDYQKRIDHIFAAILKYTVFDFSTKVPVSYKGDEIDAIAAGLNTLSEELQIRVQKLQESEERFRMLVENVKDYAIFRLDASGCIATWNKGAEHIKGYTAEEAIGKHISIFYTPEEMERNEPEYNLKMATLNGRYESEGWRKRKDGSQFWADVILTALYDDNKILQGFVKLTRDITERKRAEEQIKENEQQLQSIIRHAPDAVIVMDSESNIIRWNPKAEEIFGWSEEEITGKPLYKFIIPGSDKETHLKEIKKLLETGEGPNKTIEIEVLNKKGKEFSVSLSISAPIYVNGNYIFIAFIKDITERKIAEGRLKTSENFLDSVVENLPNMLFVKDAESLKFVKFNKAGEELLGYAREEMIGKNDYDFFPQRQADFFTQKDRLVLKGRKMEDIAEELVNTRYKGIRTLETKKIPILDENGKPKYLLGISNDITDRKKTETELKVKSEELARSNAELEQFAYVASHDLQEPLRMVTSYVQLLEKRYKDKLDQDANEFIAFAVDGSNRMRTLIQSLLEYSRVNRVKPFEPVDLDDIFEVVQHDLREVIASSNTTIKINPLPKIVGDPILIGQLFQNLISNAIKFKGKKDPEIIISGKERDKEYLFSVKDNGIGIDKEYSNKIFVIFQRLHTKDKYPGTGIGLAICKKIVERHGGEIWMESEKGEGSTFYFTIKKNTKNSI